MRKRTVTFAMVVAVAAASATAAMTNARIPDVAAPVPTDSIRPGSDSLRIASLLSSLGAGDQLTCELIADQIGNFWTNGMDEGIGRFADAPATMYSAKDSLRGRIAHPGTLRLLIATLNTDNTCVRRVGAKLLGRSRIETERLTQLLTDPSSRTREAAAYALGNGEHKTARVALERLLGGQGANEAAMAAWALGHIEDSASVPALERAVTATDARVRLAAVDALGSIEDSRSLRTLERALRNDASALVRAHAAQAIGNIGEASSVTVLAAAISDAVPAVQYAAVEALENLNDLETAPPALVKATQSGDAKLRKLAALALTEIRDPATVDALIDLVGFDDRDVRMHVAEALGDIGSPRASAGLMRLLKDADPEVRRAATEALGDIKH